MEILIVFFVAVIGFNYVHEGAHLLFAKLTGIPVEKMLLGAGPALYSRSMGGTSYELGPFPAAAMLANKADFRSSPPLSRMITSMAGPVSNFVGGFVLLFFAYLFFAAPPSAVIGEVAEDSVAHQVGLRAGDQVVGVDGSSTSDWSDVGTKLLSRVGDTGHIDLKIERDNEELAIQFDIEDWQSDLVWFDYYEYLGISPDLSLVEQKSLLQSTSDAVVDTVRYIWSFAMTGFQVIAGEIRITNLVGGLQLAQMGAHFDELTMGDYIKLVALFSIAIGVINLLPGPVVDGLAISVGFVEWVTKKELPPQVDKAMLYVGSFLAFSPLILALGVYEGIRLIT